MKRFLSITILMGMMFPLLVVAQETPIRYEFSAKTAEENKVTLQGAGFGEYPRASVSFSYLPTDNAFDGATDGQGAVITAQPGEGVMIFGERITTTNAAMIRCSLRTNQSHASVTIASIGSQPDEFIATNHPNNESYFAGQYKRIATFCIPPSTGFQPVIQIINTSETETLTAYLDNFEIYLLDPNRYTSNAFLDGDETDPPADKISILSDGDAGAIVNSGLTITIIEQRESVLLEMVPIPAGSFVMGSPNNEQNHLPDESPRHNVTIGHEFHIGRYEITQAQWEAVMGNNPSFYKGNNTPVIQISWNDCQEFLQKLNDLELDSGTFRLPTEAEWEYACRAGTTTRYYWGEDLYWNQIDNYAWFINHWEGRPQPVGQLRPNAWGLYDMNGNVGEWCQDWYGPYTGDEQTDPTGPETGGSRVQRGGGYNEGPDVMRSATRFKGGPNSTHYNVGLRIVLDRNAAL